ncbi:mucin-17-like, partial [Hyalella azteca]|uniref:Mucin-17-like n=1 Tax=Hyalella azteca TaxID=294128 RepID=A0A979FST9_HYAAZ
MTIHNLQYYLETNVPGACVPVDLLRIAQSAVYSHANEYGSVGKRTPHQRPPSGQWSGRRRLGIGSGRRGGNIDLSRGLRDYHHNSFPGPSYPSGPCANFQPKRRSRFFYHHDRPGRGKPAHWESFPAEGAFSDPGMPCHGGWNRNQRPFSAWGSLEEKPFPPCPDSRRQGPHSYPFSHSSESQHLAAHQPWRHLHHPLTHGSFVPNQRDVASNAEFYPHEMSSGDIDHYMPTYHQTPGAPWNNFPAQPSDDWEEHSDRSRSFDSASTGDNDSSQWFGDVCSELPRPGQSDSEQLGYCREGMPAAAAEECFSLVLDADGCMDRLYGGYYSDWVCGGQWGRMLEFLTTFFSSTRSHDLHVSVHFNGALEPQRMRQWVEAMQERRTNINSVLRHVSVQGSPPPKVWWVPPTGLQTALRLALRYLNVNMMVSMDDHHQEVIGFCRENCYDGVLGADAEYIAFDPPRYFSSQHLKLTYKGTLETVEFLTAEVCRSLNIPRPRLCLLTALLPNFLLSEQDFFQFHNSLLDGAARAAVPANPGVSMRGGGDLVQLLCFFISTRCSAPLTDPNLPALAAAVFGHAKDPRCGKLCAAVQYFLNGTQEGFLRYQHSSSRVTSGTCDALVTSLPSDDLSVNAAGGSAGGKLSTDSIGNKFLSASVPALTISESLHPDDNGTMGTVTSSSSVPTSSTVLSRPSPVYVTSDTSGTPSQTPGVPFLSSVSPKQRTRRHNSVPLLRNIPIICETVEEELFEAQDNPATTTYSRNSAAARRHQSIPEVIFTDENSSAVTETSSEFGTDPAVINKSLNAFGKRLTCPLIEVPNDNINNKTETAVIENEDLGAMQVPQIVIEISISEQPEENSNESNSDAEEQRILEIPSIDVTAANDDTDVEEDLEELEAETCPPDELIEAEGTPRASAYGVKEPGAGKAASELQITQEKRSSRCDKCGNKYFSTPDRGASPNGSNGSQSSEELEETPFINPDKPEHEGSPYLRGISLTTSNSDSPAPCREVAKISDASKSASQVCKGSAVTRRKRANYREKRAKSFCTCSDSPVAAEENLSATDIFVATSQKNSVRRRKMGQVQDTEKKTIHDEHETKTLETGLDKRHTLERAQSSSAMADERLARNVRTQSIPCITTTPFDGDTYASAAPDQQDQPCDEAAVSMSPSPQSPVCTSPSGKLSIPSCALSRKASDESSFGLSSRRTSGSSSAGPELLGLHMGATDDATTCSNYSEASSRRTSSASVVADLSMCSPNSAFPPEHQGFGAYCDGCSMGSSPNASRRVSGASVGEGGSCLSTASGSPGASLLLSSSSSSSNSSAASPYRLTPDVCWLGHHYRSASPDSGTSDTSDTIGGVVSRSNRRASSSFSPSPTSPSPPSPLHRRLSPTLTLTPSPASEVSLSANSASGASKTCTASTTVMSNALASNTVSRAIRARASSLPCDLLPKLPEEALERDANWSTNSTDNFLDCGSLGAAVLPQVAPEILRTASERHQKGLMHPWIYQLLTQGEIKLPPYLEDEVEPSYATFADFFRPLRQHVYAILFNLHHLTFTQTKKLLTDENSEKDPEQTEEVHQRRNAKVSFNPNTVVISGVDCDTVAEETTDSTEGDDAGDMAAERDPPEHLDATPGNVEPGVEMVALDADSPTFKVDSPSASSDATSVVGDSSEKKDSALTSASDLEAVSPLSASETEHENANLSKSLSCLSITSEQQSSEIGLAVSCSTESVTASKVTVAASGLPHTFPAPSKPSEVQQGITQLKSASSPATNMPMVVIREWVYSPLNVYETPVSVPAIPLAWPVPTVNRLWFGCSKDDSKRRLRAFLSCLRSDAPLMLQPCCVPPRLRLLAAVLRYLISGSEGCVLTRQELDAFLVTAFSSVLPRAGFLQELQLPTLSSRGVQVAGLVMAGVEVAIFANDACGGPVAWWLVAPWAFFDGKLFHYTLLRAHSSPSLLELCDNDLELVANVESCRRAILENLNISFAKVRPHDFPHPLHPLHPPLNSSSGTASRQQQGQHQQQQQ